MISIIFDSIFILTHLSNWNILVNNVGTKQGVNIQKFVVIINFIAVLLKIVLMYSIWRTYLSLKLTLVNQPKLLKETLIMQNNDDDIVRMRNENLMEPKMKKESKLVRPTITKKDTERQSIPLRMFVEE